nr:hypothetical protein [Allosalinactinospora lopnorensis]
MLGDSVHHARGRLRWTAATIAQQVPLPQHGDRSQAEFEIITNAKQRLGVPQFGALLPVHQVSAGDVVEARRHELPLDSVLDLFDARGAAGLCAQVVGDGPCHGSGQLAVGATGLARGAFDGGLDPADVERNQTPVAPSHLTRQMPVLLIRHVGAASKVRR